MYYIYENGVLIQTTALPDWQAYEPKAQSFYGVQEEDAQAVLVRPDDEGEESFISNIKGIEAYPWIPRTVEISKTPINQ